MAGKRSTSGRSSTRDAVAINRFIDALKPESSPLETPEASRGALDRLDSLSAFRVTYIGFFAFAVLYIATVSALEQALDSYFRSAIAQAIDVSGGERLRPLIVRGAAFASQRSAWVQVGGVRVTPIVLGADGSILFAGGSVALPSIPNYPSAITQENRRLRPARLAHLTVGVPHTSLAATSILISYAALFLSIAFLYARAVARREERLLGETLEARDRAAAQAAEIDRELNEARRRISRAKPEREAQDDKIHALRAERASLQEKLALLTRREEELRADASRPSDLDEEIDALEVLLTEAQDDLETRDVEIQRLQNTLKTASKPAPARSREVDVIARRLRTLYKNLEFDDRAINDLVALRDSLMLLKAEESIQRLANDSDNTFVRRKIGGFPPRISVCELNFAGKGRIYFTTASDRRYRILSVGAKNTQKTDLEYLRKLKL